MLRRVKVQQQDGLPQFYFPAVTIMPLKIILNTQKKPQKNIEDLHKIMRIHLLWGHIK